MNRELYKPRIIDASVEKYLMTFGAVCIEGPKWCGKTWTSAYHSKSEYYLADPRGNFQNRNLAQIDPSLVLDGDSPRLLDEWQEVPALWDAVRFAVDSSKEKGRFILTGSATPSGKVSLKDLCNGILKTQLTGEVTLTDLIGYIVRGGWPSSQELPIEEAALLPKEYISAILSDDIERIDGIKRDRHKMELLLRSLARNESTTVTNKRLKEDMKEIDHEDIVVETVASYLDVLNRLFLTDNQKTYSSQLRSTVRVKQAEKRHLSDPSLACALLNATPEILKGDLNTLGFLFEALCERDLKIYAEAFGASLYHYQDYHNQEIDAVIVLPDGEWCGIEIKLGANQIEDAAKNLLKIKQKILEEKNGKAPKSLSVICGLSNAAYQREDGVFVVPLTALGV